MKYLLISKSLSTRACLFRLIQARGSLGLYAEYLNNRMGKYSKLLSTRKESLELLEKSMITFLQGKAVMQSQHRKALHFLLKDCLNLKSRQSLTSTSFLLKIEKNSFAISPILWSMPRKNFGTPSWSSSTKRIFLSQRKAKAKRPGRSSTYVPVGVRGGFVQYLPRKESRNFIKMRPRNVTTNSSAGLVLTSTKYLPTFPRSGRVLCFRTCDLE